MRSIVNLFGNPTDPTEQYGKRIQAADFVRTRGTQQIPYPPRDLFAQSASRGLFVTWKLPERKSKDIAGWRIYKGDENTLYKSIQDRGTRQITVEASAGTTVAVFVSSVNALGRESQKVQVIKAITGEAGAPAIPTPPPGYTGESAGGGDQSTVLGGTSSTGSGGGGGRGEIQLT